MAKSATVKDVLYALEFLNGRLIMRPATTAGGAVSWVVEPGSIRVPHGIADQVKTHSTVVGLPGRIGEAVYVWRIAA